MGCIFSNLNSCSTTGTFRIVNFPIYKPVPKYLCAMSWRACQPACLGGHHIHCSIMATPHKFCVSLSDTCIALYGFKSIFLKQYKKYAPPPPPTASCGGCFQHIWRLLSGLRRLLSAFLRMLPASREAVVCFIQIFQYRPDDTKNACRGIFNFFIT